MMKRNDGYALSYVLVVLLVLCTIALSVMTISLNNLKRQQASIDRMADKYSAQGLIEQVVAQLENAENEEAVNAILDTYKTESGVTKPVVCDPIPSTEPVKYKLTSAYEETTVTAEFELTPVTRSLTPEGPSEPTEIHGYAVTYTSYTTEVTP